MKLVRSINIFLLSSALFFTALFAFLYVANTGKNLHRVPFKPPQASAQAWDEVFRHPQDISVTTYAAGTINVKKSAIENLKHPNAIGIQDEEMTVPVKAYLLKHAVHGYWLVDAGFDQSYAKKPHGSMRGVFSMFVPKSSQIEGQALSQILAKQNITPDGVFLTHLHFDHTAGILDFPSERMAFTAGKGELYLNLRYILHGEHLGKIKELQEIDFSQTKSFAPFGPAVDVFGDGSLWAIATPGHTPGQVSYLVNSTAGPELITGDACNLKEELEKGIGPGSFSSDLKQAQISLDEIRAFKQKYPQVKIQCGHEL
jgi:glyoxylase-like metal-dependent hydrolase (beta-lactamase superfamily II)